MGSIRNRDFQILLGMLISTAGTVPGGASADDVPAPRAEFGSSEPSRALVSQALDGRYEAREELYRLYEKPDAKGPQGWIRKRILPLLSSSNESNRRVGAIFIGEAIRRGETDLARELEERRKKSGQESWAAARALVESDSEQSVPALLNLVDRKVPEAEDDLPMMALLRIGKHAKSPGVIEKLGAMIRDPAQKERRMDAFNALRDGAVANRIDQLPKDRREAYLETLLSVFRRTSPEDDRSKELRGKALLQLYRVFQERLEQLKKSDPGLKGATLETVISQCFPKVNLAGVKEESLNLMTMMIPLSFIAIGNKNIEREKEAMSQIRAQGLDQPRDEEEIGLLRKVSDWFFARPIGN